MLPANPLFVETILTRMPVGLMILDCDGNIARTNPALSAMLGIAPHELQGRGWAEVFMAEGNNLEFNQVIVDVVHNELEFLSRSVPFVDPAGSRRELGVLSCFIRQQDSVAGIVLLFQDMTELARMHDAERRIYREKLRLEREREEALRLLAQAVAHQVRNPATVIGGVAGMLIRQHSGEPALGRMLDVIREETLRLEAMVAEVSSFAAISAGVLHRVDWHALLHGWAADRLAEADEADIVLHACTGMGVVYPDLVRLLLDELYDNARRFAHTDRALKVTVSVSHEDGWTRLVMQDNGRGMGRDSLPYVFDPFFTSRSDGVGMGLCKVKRCMMLHGGTAAAENVHGGGARFIMRFPPRSASAENGDVPPPENGLR